MDRDWPAASSGWRAAVWLALFLTVLPSGAALAAEEILRRLEGRWAGTADGGRAEADWTLRRDGFDLRWSGPDTAAQSASFRPTGRPGVYGTQDGAGWSMFEQNRSVNPLEGGMLRWARTAPDAVYVYSLSVDDRGMFVLDRYRYQPSAEGLQVSRLRELPGRQERTEATLSRVAP